MKRAVAIVAGVVTLGAGLYVGSRGWAQAPAAGGAAAPAATMRLRLVNLQHVIKNYKRTEALRNEHTAVFKKYDDDINKMKTELDGRNKQLVDPQYAAHKEGIEKEIKRLQRDIQDKGEEARTALAKKEGELITLIYNEVEDAVRKYAAMNGIELVMHYNDAVADADRRSANNIARKMSAGACMPMYMAGGLDISQEIVETLNKQYTGPSASAVPPAPAAGQR